MQPWWRAYISTNHQSVDSDMTLGAETIQMKSRLRF